MYERKADAFAYCYASFWGLIEEEEEEEEAEEEEEEAEEAEEETRPRGLLLFSGLISPRCEQT